MTAGAQVIELVIYWLITNTLTFLIVILDERRMPDEMLERAWPAPSRDVAIVGFGPLALLVHFIKTRTHLRSLWGLWGFIRGVLLGVIAIALVSVVGGLVVDGVAWVLGFPELPDQ